MSDIIKFDPSLTAARGLEQRAEFPAALLRSGDPRQWGHYYLERRDIGLVAGIWQNAAFESQSIPFGGNEFFIVVDGIVEIEEPDGRIAAVAKGEAAVIPHGLRHRWIQKAPARLFFAKYTAPAGAETAAPQRVVRIDTSIDMPPSGTPAREMLLSQEMPSTTEHTFFSTPDGKMTVGMWTATPYRRRSIPYPRFEMMHVLEGGTRFPMADGNEPSASAGETVLVCKGAEAQWWNEVPIRKIAFNFLG